MKTTSFHASLSNVMRFMIVLAILNMAMGCTKSAGPSCIYFTCSSGSCPEGYMCQNACCQCMYHPGPSGGCPTGRSLDGNNCCTVGGSSSSATAWNKTFGGEESDVALSGRQAVDGTYIVAGFTKSKGMGDYDGWVVKLDSQGELEWDRTLGGVEEDMLYDVICLNDGFLAVGSTKSKGAGSSDCWVVKMGPNGGGGWEKTFGGGEADTCSKVRHSGDGGFLIAGSTKSQGSGDSDMWLAKLDPAGNLVWQKSYGGAYDQVTYDMQVLGDGGTVLAGTTKSMGAAGTNAYLVRTDRDGNLSWAKSYGGSADDLAASVLPLPDTGFLLAGYTKSIGAGKMDGWALRLTNDGNVVWEKTYGGVEDDGFASITPASDGGFIAVGGNSSEDVDFDDLWVIKIDEAGAKLWEKIHRSTHGSPNVGGTDRAYHIAPTDDGGYIVAGVTIYLNHWLDFWILKLNAAGLACTPGAKIYKDCKGDDVYWYDDCGTAVEVAESCGQGRSCKDAICVDCTSHDHKGCYQGDVYWYDSCGRREDLYDNCSSGEQCSGGVCGPSCRLTNCSETSFTYTCASGNSTTNYTYGGPGPNGVSRVTVNYSNGHTVTCRYYSSYSGSCSDDTGASCTF